MGLGSTEIIALLVGAAVGMAAFVAVELRVRVPMVAFRFFSIVTSSVWWWCCPDRLLLDLLGVFFFLALDMQASTITRRSRRGPGSCPRPMIVGARRYVDGSADRFGPRWLIAAGSASTVASLYSFSGIAVDPSYLDRRPAPRRWTGIAPTMSLMTSAAINAVAVEKAGIASGVLSMFRMVGGSLGVAVTGAIFQGSVGTTTFAEASPQQLRRRPRQAMGICCAVALTGAVIGAVAIGARRTDPVGRLPSGSQLRRRGARRGRGHWRGVSRYPQAIRRLKSRRPMRILFRRRKGRPSPRRRAVDLDALGFAAELAQAEAWQAAASRRPELRQSTRRASGRGLHGRADQRLDLPGRARPSPPGGETGPDRQRSLGLRGPTDRVHPLPPVAALDEVYGPQSPIARRRAPRAGGGDARRARRGDRWHAFGA